MLLKVQNLSVSVGEKKLLTNINLSVSDTGRHLLMGHNGSGKSTLVQTISANPEYKIDGGQIIFDGRDITGENTTTRALMGIFLGAQNVPEIAGLTVTSFLKHSANAHAHFQTGKSLSVDVFLRDLENARTRLDIPKDWLMRSINLGFSGGEKKKLMLLRLVLTRPKLAILDEPDSGTDAIVQQMIADIIGEMPQTAFLIISHQNKFQELIPWTQTTTLSHGKIMI